MSVILLSAAVSVRVKMYIVIVIVRFSPRLLESSSAQFLPLPWPEHSISYISDEQRVWVCRCPGGLFKWGTSVLLLVMILYLRSVCFLEIRQGIPSKTLWQWWAELTGLAVSSTSGCFGLQGLSKHLGRHVRMLPMGPVRRIVRMYNCFRMSEACV